MSTAMPTATRAKLEARLGTLLGVTAAIAWLLFELYAGLQPARNTEDCGCDGAEGPAEFAGEPIEDRE